MFTANAGDCDNLRRLSSRVGQSSPTLLLNLRIILDDDLKDMVNSYRLRNYSGHTAHTTIAPIKGRICGSLSGVETLTIHVTIQAILPRPHKPLSRGGFAEQIRGGNINYSPNKRIPEQGMSRKKTREN